MALLGKIPSLKYLFYKTEPMQSLCAYLLDAIDSNSAIHKRILSQNAEEKIPLQHGMFAIEQSYYLKDLNRAVYETHLRFVDFQLVVFGQEFFALGNKEDFTIQKIDEARDLIFYKPCENFSKILLSPRSLAIFFEDDVHAGGLALEGLEKQMRVHKTVVKVPKELLKLKL
ncbi:flagellar motor-switch protein [Helicobacter mustelae]|nr:flagellar motor-switch protein [Helicobacter mustelae]